MGAAIHFIYDIRGQHCTCMLCKIWHLLCVCHKRLTAGVEFIRSTAGLKTEVGNQVHISCFVQDRNGQFAAFVNHFVGIVVFV